MTIPWKEYQEEAASFFKSLGLDASTDVTVDGVRTTHDIDVLVKSRHAGFEVTWISGVQTLEDARIETPHSRSTRNRF